MEDDLVSRVLSEIGRKGGLKGGPKGGKVRMGALTPEQRTALAKKGAAARWKTKKKRKS